MTKKRNKRYNPLKSVEKISQAGLHGMVVTFSGLDDSCKVFDVNKGKFYDPISPNLFKAIWNVRHNWRMYLALKIEQKNGKVGCVYQVMDTQEFPVFQTEIEASLTKAHKEFAAEEQSKGNEIINVGWVADPKGKDIFTSEKIDSILSKIGV